MSPECEVHTAANGSDALGLLHEIAGLIVASWNGRELVERLYGQPLFASWPFVVQSAEDGPSPAGVASRVNNPVDIPALHRTVKQHCIAVSSVAGVAWADGWCFGALASTGLREQPALQSCG